MFNSDAEAFGGSNVINEGEFVADPTKPMHGCEQSIELTLPPLATIYLQCKEDQLLKKVEAAPAEPAKKPVRRAQAVRKAAAVKKTKPVTKTPAAKKKRTKKTATAKKVGEANE